MEHVEEMIQLMKDNPKLKVVAMVDSDVVADPDYSWWIARFGKASVEEIYNQDERVFVRSQDEGTLVDEVADDLEPEVGEQEAYDIAKDIVDAYAWEKVIAVRVQV